MDIHFDFRVQTPKYEIIRNGTVITINGNPIDFYLNGLTYQFSFQQDISTQNVEVKASPIDGNPLAIRLLFLNMDKAPLGYGSKEPVKVGNIDNRAIYLNFRIYALQGAADFLIHYTWYISNDIDG